MINEPKKNNDLSEDEDWIKVLRGESVSEEFKQKKEYEIITAFREKLLWESAKDEAETLPSEKTEKAWKKFQDQNVLQQQKDKLEPSLVSNIEVADKKAQIQIQEWMSIAASVATLCISLFILYHIQSRYEAIEQISERTLQVSEQILKHGIPSVSKENISVEESEKPPSKNMFPEFVAKGETPQEFSMNREEIKSLLYDLAIVDLRVIMKREGENIRISIDDIYPLRASKEATLNSYSIDYSPDHAVIVLIITIEK